MPFLLRNLFLIFQSDLLLFFISDRSLMAKNLRKSKTNFGIFIRKKSYLRKLVFFGIINFSWVVPWFITPTNDVNSIAYSPHGASCPWWRQTTDILPIIFNAVVPENRNKSYPGRTFSVKRWYYSEIANVSAHTASIILTFTDAPSSLNNFGEKWRLAFFCQEAPSMSLMSQKKNAAKLWWGSPNVNVGDFLPEESNRFPSFQYKTFIGLMYFQGSDTTILWINFCVEKIRKPFLLEKLWSSSGAYTIILWTEGSLTEDWNSEFFKIQLFFRPSSFGMKNSYWVWHKNVLQITETLFEQK